MNNLSLIFSFINGILLGIVFFGGLWLTVKFGILSKNPALWFITSFMLRMMIIMIGFYYLIEMYWFDLAISIVGFVIARIIVLRLTKSTVTNQN